MWKAFIERDSHRLFPSGLGSHTIQGNSNHTLEWAGQHQAPCRQGPPCRALGRISACSSGSPLPETAFLLLLPLLDEKQMQLQETWAAKLLKSEWTSDCARYRFSLLPTAQRHNKRRHNFLSPFGQLTKLGVQGDGEVKTWMQMLSMAWAVLSCSFISCFMVGTECLLISWRCPAPCTPPLQLGRF